MAGNLAHVSHADLAHAAGISEARLTRLVHLGLIEPVRPGGDVFTAATAVRLRRMMRLRRDLGVGLESAAIILDLLDRLEQLTREHLR